MMAVRCPACSERVEGSSSEDLSRSIRSHFADVHKMDIEVEMRTSDEGCGCGPETGRAGGEAPRGAESSEEFRGGADRMRQGEAASGQASRSSPTPGGGIGPGAKVDEKEKSFEVSDTRDMQGMGGRSSGVTEPMGTGASGSEDTRGISERSMKGQGAREGPEAGGQGSEFRGGADTMREGPGGASSRPTPGGGIGPGVKVDEKEKSFEVSDTRDMQGMGARASGVVEPMGTGASGSEDTRGIRMEFECPMCRERIEGSSEEEASSKFKKHLTTAHKDEPFVTQLMEKVGSR